MSDQSFEEDSENISELKNKAKALGIVVRGNPKAETLQNMIKEAQPTVLTHEERPMNAEATVPTATSGRYDPIERLSRVLVTCHNPAKSSLTGIILDVGNSLKSSSKFIKFNEPYHLSDMHIDALKSKSYLVHVTTRDVNGNEITRARAIPEFSVQVLDPLTDKDLAALAKRQSILNEEKLDDLV